MPRQPRDESPESDVSSHSLYRNVVVVQPPGDRPQAMVGQDSVVGPEVPAGHEAYYDLESATYLAVDRRNYVAQYFDRAGRWMSARREGLVKLLIDVVPTFVQSTAAVLPEDHPAKKNMTYAGIGVQAAFGVAEVLFESAQAIQGNEFTKRNIALGAARIMSASAGGAGAFLEQPGPSRLSRSLNGLSNYGMGAVTVTKAALDMGDVSSNDDAKRALEFQRQNRWPMNNPVLPLHDVQRAQPHPYPTVSHAASSHSIPGHGGAVIRSSASGSHDPQSVRMRHTAAAGSPAPITPPPPRATYDPNRPPAAARTSANRRSNGSHLS
ncbi:hypothetical protein ACGGAI_35520 [Streptomyces antibioticus]|uniref:hypothetical protein n=1 Tax=Streptomyces antibioticus TaxID=1890 RepID=UPI0037159B0C